MSDFLGAPYSPCFGTASIQSGDAQDVTNLRLKRRQYWHETWKEVAMVTLSACSLPLQSFQKRTRCPRVSHGKAEAQKMVGCAEVTLALEWTPKPSCNFSVAQVQMSEIDKMEEINGVFANREKGRLCGNGLFPSYIITSTNSEEETVIYALSAQ